MPSRTESSSQIDCVVIGAGLAGLAAAEILHQAGKSFVILEAQNRIGGRAYTVPLSDGTALERGAGFIQGSRVSTWDYVIRYSLTTHGGVSPPVRTMGMVFDGERWQREEEDAEMATVWARIVEEWMRPDYENVVVLDALGESGFTERQIDAVKKELDLRMAIDLHEVSARGAAEVLRLSRSTTANYAIVEGYGALCEGMSAQFVDKIQLEMPVTTIDWSDDGVLVHAGDERVEARTLIATLPLGVLKAETVEFRPSLPDFKIEAIRGLRMKRTSKVSAEFRRPFWEGRIGTATTFGGRNSPFAWFVHFAGRPGPPVLTSVVGFTHSKQFSSHPENFESAFFADFERLFPDVDVRSELVEFIVSDWPADPWARGTTSIAPVGSYHLRRQLGAPTPPLFWAGEATPTDGTARAAHGALSSGRTAAVEALHLLRPWAVSDPASRRDWSRFPD
jgi:monoamine oxidase